MPLNKETKSIVILISVYLIRYLHVYLFSIINKLGYFILQIFKHIA